MLVLRTSVDDFVSAFFMLQLHQILMCQKFSLCCSSHAISMLCLSDSLLKRVSFNSKRNSRRRSLFEYSEYVYSQCIPFHSMILTKKTPTENSKICRLLIIVTRELAMACSKSSSSKTPKALVFLDCCTSVRKKTCMTKQKLRSICASENTNHFSWKIHEIALLALPTLLALRSSFLCGFQHIFGDVPLPKSETNRNCL